MQWPTSAASWRLGELRRRRGRAGEPLPDGRRMWAPPTRHQRPRRLLEQSQPFKAAPAYGLVDLSVEVSRTRGERVQIDRIHVEAYKSLYDVDCELDRFSVVTGPNGAGKSNLVDAINFVGEVYKDGLEFAVGRGGGYENLAHRRTRRAKRPIALSVDLTLDSEDLVTLTRFYGRGVRAGNVAEELTPLTYHHSFSIGTASQSLISEYDIRSDGLTVRNRFGERLLSLARTSDGVEIDADLEKINGSTALESILDPFGDEKFWRYVRQTSNRNSLLLNTASFSPLLQHIRSSLGGTRVFQLSPSQCRNPGVPTPNAALNRYGDNLPAAADNLRRNDPAAWNLVQSGMTVLMPSLRGIDLVYTEERRLAVAFREQGVRRPWSSGEVSDGTIQALALLIALYDKRYSVLVVEEPENSIHPWIVRQFIDLCRESRKQILLTTHSPVVLNYVSPDSVLLMSARHGRSRIDKLLDVSPSVRPMVLDGELSLFEVYDSGLIRSSVPHGFSPSDDDEDLKG